VGWPDQIALRIGSAWWLITGHRLFGLCGLLAILCSGARAAWIIVAACAWFATQAAARRAMRKAADVSALVLRSDGSALIMSPTGTEEALPCAGGWVSRWFSVVTLELLADGSRIRVLVCRSVNDADAYRHLLTHLRLANPEPSRGTMSQA